VSGDVHVLRGDVEDQAVTCRAIHNSEPEVIFHLASTSFNPPISDPSQHLRVIALGTRNVLSAVPVGAGTRIVYTGSGAEYGSGSDLTEEAPLLPATELGVAKAAATLLMQSYARMYKHHTVSLRLFTPYGPREQPTRLIPYTILSALRKEDVRISSGEQRRDYVFVDDVVDALLLAASKPVAPGSVYNVCSGDSTSVVDVVRSVLRLMGDPVQVVRGALPTRADEIWECSGSNHAAGTALGWRPRVSLLAGLTQSITWLQKQGASN
jgi:nucleoside-diphosphate-sugar epimerase